MLEKIIYACFLFNEARRHVDVCGGGGRAPPFFTSALSVSSSATESPERYAVFHLIEDCVGPTAGRDAVSARKISCRFRESNCFRPTPSDDSSVPALVHGIVCDLGLSRMLGVRC
jgi:hypothetical protein